VLSLVAQPGDDAGLAATGNVAAMLVDYAAGGRPTLAFAFDCAAWSPTCQLVGRLAVGWLLEGRPAAAGVAGVSAAASPLAASPTGGASPPAAAPEAAAAPGAAAGEGAPAADVFGGNATWTTVSVSTGAPSTIGDLLVQSGAPAKSLAAAGDATTAAAAAQSGAGRWAGGASLAGAVVGGVLLAFAL
jgi:hypothetical protein